MNSSSSKKQYSLFQIMIWVLFWTSLRIVSEKLLLFYPIRMDPFQEHIRILIEYQYYFMILFILLCLLTVALVKKTFIEVANFGAWIFPLVIIPPYIDRFLMGRWEGYIYGSVENLWSNILTLCFASGEAGLGISLEILLGLICISAYVQVKTRSAWKSCIAWFGSSSIIMILSTPELFVGSLADFLFLPFLPIYYYIPFLILCFVMYGFYDIRKLKSVMGNLRLTRASIFLASVFLGYFSAIQLGASLNITRLLLTLGSVFLCWEVSVVVNDICDIEIDQKTNLNRPLIKNILSKKEYAQVAWFFAYFSLSCTIIMGKTIFMLNILWLLLALMYSIPPIRLRRNICGNFVIGFALLISFIQGIISVGGTSILLDRKNVAFSLLVLLFGIVVPLTKDLKDIEGDTLAHVSNIFTNYGRVKGKKIVTAFLGITLMLPVFFIVQLKIALLVAGCAIFASFIFYRRENEKWVYVISAVEATILYIYLYYCHTF